MFCLILFLLVYLNEHCTEQKAAFHYDFPNQTNQLATSLILEASNNGSLTTQNCIVRIQASEHVDGLILAVQNISIENHENIGQQEHCVNYIQFNDGTPQAGLWCNTSDASGLVFEKGIDISIVGTTSFKFQITPFQSQFINFILLFSF